MTASLKMLFSKCQKHNNPIQRFASWKYCHLATQFMLSYPKYDLNLSISLLYLRLAA